MKQLRLPKRISLSSLVVGALALSATVSPPAQAGWLFDLPPNTVWLDSGRRNPVFYVGEPVSFTLSRAATAVRYEVRNYYGDLVAQGALSGTTLNLPGVTLPGWYKVYLYAKKSTAPWGTSVGGTTFVIYRNTLNFPQMPSSDTPGGTYPSEDEAMRGVIGMGPQRTSVQDAAKPDDEIARLETNVSLDKYFYMPYDPVRQRKLFFAFPNGTAGKEDGVRAIARHFKNDVQYYEPRNEPNFGASGADFATQELKPFYEAVKSVDSNLKVIGPGTVSIGPNAHGLYWLEDFLKAGGANYLDGFSFHAYNTVNGDLTLARTALESLNALLKKYNADNLPKWQTEQGYFAACYGAYQPRLQGRWTMLQMMVYEQYGIPKEQNHLWYDKGHGFWDFPAWWQNDDGSLNPAASLMRVWSEELYGTHFASAYDFGPVGNKLYIGSLFAAPDNSKRVAAFQSAGSPDGQVELTVGGTQELRIISPFGVEGRLAVGINGRVTLPVSELPVYVELVPGQTINVVPEDWGANLLLAPGVTEAASGKTIHPVDKTIPNSITKITNGVLENWYWNQDKPDHPWMSNTTFPGWVEVQLPAPTTISRVVIYAAPPWQYQSTLLDYDLQYQNSSGAWVTVAKVNEPTKTFNVFTPATRTKVDSYFSDRWVFQHKLAAPVTTSKLRLTVRNTTFGGGATKDVPNAGGQAGPRQIVLREIEAYAR
jgi:hypothetical protein